MATSGENSVPSIEAAALEGDSVHVREKLLLLGAGASQGARDAWLCRPPLGDQLLEHLVEFLEERLPEVLRERCFSSEEYDRVYRFLSAAGREGLSYEEAINEHLRGGLPDESLLQSINKVLLLGFTHAPSRGPAEPAILNPGLRAAGDGRRDLYDDLVRRLELASCEWAVVSLNYECLFEEALDRAGIGFYYVGTSEGEHSVAERPKQAVPIYKIHGSVNWFPISPQESGRPEPSSVSAEAASIRVAWSSGGALHPSGAGFDAPVVAHYAVGKAGLTAPDCLRRLRGTAIQAAEAAREAIFVGTRIAGRADDPPLWGVLLRLREGGCRVQYVSPVPEDCQRAEDCFEFVAYRSTLAQWLLTPAED